MSRQLGHANPSITLSVYAHLFDAAEHGRRASEALEAGFGKILESSGDGQRRIAAAAAPAQVVPLQVFSSHND